MGQPLKIDFLEFFLILLPKKLQSINFEGAIKIGSGNIGPQSLQKVFFHLLEFRIRAKAGELY